MGCPDTGSSGSLCWHTIPTRDSECEPQLIPRVYYSYNPPPMRPSPHPPDPSVLEDGLSVVDNLGDVTLAAS
eukprot:754981-Hanusia_phi.AAC.5